MTTPYDGKILLVIRQGFTTPGETPAGTAALLRDRIPNVAGVMLRTSHGVSWAGSIGNDHGPKAVTGVRRIADWVEAFAAQGLEVHVWGAPRARQSGDIDREAEKLAQAATVPGVASLLLHVEQGEEDWQGTPPMARALMDATRRGVNPDTHIGLILDGRRNRPFEFWVDPWMSDVDSLHPTVYPILFGRDRSIEEHIGRAYANLLPYLKPIYPMLQSGYAGDRPTADEITRQGLAAARGSTGMSFFRLGADPSPVDHRPVMDEEAYAAIAAIPWQLVGAGLESLESLESAGLYNWGQVINATYDVAATVGADGWGWLSGPPGQVRYKQEMNLLPYDGVPVDQWPLDPSHQRQILDALVRRYGQLRWGPMRGAGQTPTPVTPAPVTPTPVTPAPVTPAPVTPTPKPVTPPVTPPRPAVVAGSKVGIHGHPAPITPPRDQWDEWLGYLKGMGIRWYKQLDWGNPNDMQNDSTFAWAVRLKKEGIEPIIRFYKSEQFPGRLDGVMFDKMRLYAERDIRWVEIGNEPNLDYEWKSDWRHRVSCNDADVIRALAEGWVADARSAIAAGARPGFYAFGPTDWESGRPHPKYSSVNFTRNTVKYLADHFRGETLDIFNRGGWIAVHCATYDRAIDFDPHGVNPPWDMALRGYEVPRRAFREFFGNSLNVDGIPIISTEGGVFTQDCKYLGDNQKARSGEDHAAAVVAMYRYVEHSTPLQAMCPWCITTIGTHDEKFAGDGWIIERNGVRSGRPVTDAMRQLQFDNARRAEDNQPGRKRIKLNVPYISQLDSTANLHGADCGPTCLTMILNYDRVQPLTVNELYQGHAILKDKLGKKGPDGYTNFGEMALIAEAYDVSLARNSYTEAGEAFTALQRHMNNATPFIALVNYERWQDIPDLKANNYKDSHFVVVTGCDDEFIFVHDPLFSNAAKGQHFVFRADRFLDGWGNMKQGNPSYSALVPNRQVSRLEAMGG